jgi:hypothetical protein
MEAATAARLKTQATGTLESFNPATGELVGSVGTITPDQVQAVVDEAAEVQPFWAELSLDDRARYLRATADALLADIDEIAELLTREQGKPRVESYTPLVRRQRPRDPRRRAHPLPTAVPEDEEELLQLRADRSRRGDRAVELPMVDPVRRGRDRADGGQRRRA